MKQPNIVIGIEGLVGAGKTSICRELLNKIPNSILLNGSNLYRGIVYTMIKEYKSIFKILFNIKKINIKELMDKYNIELRLEGRETNIYADRVQIQEEELQSNKNSLAVSLIAVFANHKDLFDFAKDLIIKYKQDYNIILSGRAIKKIYPEIDYHFFITADEKERINRKCIQYEQKSKAKIKRSIKIRDYLQKRIGLYNIAEDTISVDVTDCKNVQESTEKVLNYIELKSI